jgi:hypothetical protein
VGVGEQVEHGAPLQAALPQKLPGRPDDVDLVHVRVLSHGKDP